MKKIIIPIAATLVGVIAAIGLVAFTQNKAAADDPETLIEIKDGNYYIDGDPANNELYIVVENDTIRYATDLNDLREAFTRSVEADEEIVFDTEEAFEAQIDYFVSEWGGTYTYDVMVTQDNRALVGIIAGPDEHENEQHYHGGFGYSNDTKTFDCSRGNFVLYKET